MQQYQDVVAIIGPPGLMPIVGANVTVWNFGTSSNATIYNANSTNNPVTNPLTSDSSGRYNFYAANGHYTLQISGTSIQTTVLRDILLYDSANDNFLLPSMFVINTSDAYSGVGTASTGAPRIFAGTNAQSGDDSAFLLGRAVNGNNLFSHGFRDESTFESTSTGAYASFDSNVTMNGTLNPYNHLGSFQARLNYNGSGVLNDIQGFLYGSFANGVVVNATGFRILNTGGTGTVTNQYGIKIDDLTKGTNNWSILTGSAKSVFGGPVGVGSAPVNNGQFEVIATSSDCQAFITANSSGSAILNLFPNGPTKTAQISAQGATTLKLRTNNADALFIDSSQRVGVGLTPANGGNFEVITATGDCGVFVTANSTGSASINLFPNGGGVAQLSATGAAALRLNTNSITAITISSSQAISFASSTRVGFYGINATTRPGSTGTSFASLSLSSGALASTLAIALNALGLINCSSVAP